MPDQNPAQELRTAANLLRHAAQRATHQQGARWMRGTTSNRSDVVLDHPDEPTVLIETFAERLEAVNVYLTLVGPATGEAVADWLDREAAIWAEMETLKAELHPKGFKLSWPVSTHAEALAVASAILGRPS
jgi:hypothetical protein